MSNQTAKSTKVLRIGLFQNNRIIEERLLRTAKPVSIGSDLKKNMFVVPASTLPKSQTVFEVKNGAYVLKISKDMTGRVKVGDKLQTLQDLIQSGRAQKGAEGYSLTLPPNAQGRLVLGEATLLFQFVTPPPARPKPVLPASMRGGWIQGMDRILATMLAVSLILHVGFVAFLELQDWPEPLESEFQIPDQFVSIIVDKKEEEPEPEDKKVDENAEGEGEAKNEEPAPEPKKKASPEPKAEDKPDKKPKSAEEMAKAEADRKRRLAEKVRNKTILGQIGAKSADGSSGGLVDMLTEGAGKTSVEDAFANANGVTTGQAGAEKSSLRSSGSSGADGKGGKSVGIGALKAGKGVKRAEGGVKTGEKKQKRVKARVNIKGPEKFIGGTLDKSSVSRILKRKASAFQKCYERELKKNPKAGGKVVVLFTIGQAGRVTSSSSRVDSVGGGVGGCVAGQIKRLRFPRPKGGDATISKTFVFSSGN